MLIRKIIVCLIASIAWVSSAYAGTEDWKGTFMVQAVDGHLYKFTHTASQVHFLFFTAGSCLYLGQGTRLNDLKIPQDMELCVNQSIDEFRSEIQKFGFIVDETIEAGPTYSQTTPNE